MARKCDLASSAKDMHEKLNGRIITQNVTIVTTNKYKIEVIGKVIDQVICSQNGINRSLWMKAFVFAEANPGNFETSAKLPHLNQELPSDVVNCFSTRDFMRVRGGLIASVHSDPASVRPTLHAAPRVGEQSIAEDLFPPHPAV